MEINDKIVEFEKYCKKCEFRYCPQDMEPCDECLSNPVNENSKKPIKFIKDEKIKDEEENKEEN